MQYKFIIKFTFCFNSTNCIVNQAMAQQFMFKNVSFNSTNCIVNYFEYI